MIYCAVGLAMVGQGSPTRPDALRCMVVGLRGAAC